jgi:hypothetical protein
MNTKCCTKCGLDKPSTEFYKRSDGGINSQCKQCIKDRHKAYHQSEDYRQWYGQSRDSRVARKEKYRREAGATPRFEIARVAEERKALAEQRSTERANQRSTERAKKAALNDWHVKRYLYVMQYRRNSAKWYEQNSEIKGNYQKNRKLALPDSYVAQNLKSMGLLPEQITERFIALKREAMQFRRLSLQAKTAISNHYKENHEALTEHT